jgi:hypothetical protein
MGRGSIQGPEGGFRAFFNPAELPDSLKADARRGMGFGIWQLSQ